jgi:hypothetical protein
MLRPHNRPAPHVREEKSAHWNSK